MYSLNNKVRKALSPLYIHRIIGNWAHVHATELLDIRSQKRSHKNDDFIELCRNYIYEENIVIQKVNSINSNAI